MPADAVLIRRGTPDDWRDLRALRLEALADTPIGLFETLVAAKALGSDDWLARAARGAEGGDSFQALAFSGGCAVGTCVTFRPDGRDWLAAVYVTPSQRGTGLIGRLVDACARHAAARGSPELVLEVHEHNVRARRAYARLGFIETGTTTPYPLQPGGLEVVMALPLADPARG